MLDVRRLFPARTLTERSTVVSNSHFFDSDSFDDTQIFFVDLLNLKLKGPCFDFP